MNPENIYTIYKDELPERLKHIPEPPKKLYVIGKLPAETTKVLCVVGPRRYSSYGEEACKKLIAGLKGHDICIVSGLAIGIDSIAHRAALDAGLPTIAFPGSGLGEKVLYPAKNKKLAEEIIYAGGAVISEYEHWQMGADWTFPRRNRLMAGISQATLVIEGRQKSGTLITSRLATEYDRDVGAVPGQITSELSEGPHMLIRIGATPITCPDDILEMLRLKTKREIEDEKAHTGAGKNIQPSLLLHLTATERMIIEILQIEMQSSEQIVLKTGLSVQEINMAISSLEIQGFIIESGGRFRMA